jgi:regulator of protease activity HflC (stomatin/prohibitin superfamily)
LPGVVSKLSLISKVLVVQEYERAVIFRLGRLLNGGAKGPGIYEYFFKFLANNTRDEIIEIAVTPYF